MNKDKYIKQIGELDLDHEGWGSTLEDFISNLIDEVREETKNEPLTMAEAVELSKDKDKETRRLIEQIREEAVREFATYLWEDVVRYDNEQELKEALEAYLQTLKDSESKEVGEEH